MPPRKSDASKVPVPGGDDGTPVKEREGVNIEDLNLPKSIVTRLAKGVLPPNTQIQANAVLAMTKSATVFVNYLATQANEHTQNANKKTVGPADVLRALDDLDFADFKPRLEQELAKFNELATDKRNAYRKRVAAEKAGGIPTGGTPSTATNGEASGSANPSAEPDGEPASKKARLEDPQGEQGSVPEGELGDDTEGQSPENDHDHDHDHDTDHDNEEGEDAEEEEEEEEKLEPTGEEEIDEEPKETQPDEALDNGDDSD